jgi:hypothetical protein
MGTVGSVLEATGAVGSPSENLPQGRVSFLASAPPRPTIIDGDWLLSLVYWGTLGSRSGDLSQEKVAFVASAPPRPASFEGDWLLSWVYWGRLDLLCCDDVHCDRPWKGRRSNLADVFVESIVLFVEPTMAAAYIAPSLHSCRKIS